MYPDQILNVFSLSSVPELMAGLHSQPSSINLSDKYFYVFDRRTPWVNCFLDKLFFPRGLFPEYCFIRMKDVFLLCSYASYKEISTNDVLHPKLPFPNCPKKFSPVAQSVPSCLRIIVCIYPPETYATSVIIWTGVSFP